CRANQSKGKCFGTDSGKARRTSASKLPCFRRTIQPTALKQMRLCPQRNLFYCPLPARKAFMSFKRNCWIAQGVQVPTAQDSGFAVRNICGQGRNSACIVTISNLMGVHLQS